MEVSIDLLCTTFIGVNLSSSWSSSKSIFDYSPSFLPGLPFEQKKKDIEKREEGSKGILYMTYGLVQASAS